jgi:hypothetical protein
MAKLKEHPLCHLPTVFVVRDLAGLETFICAEHAKNPRWILLTPFVAWFEARGLPAPDPEDRPCTGLAWA